MPENISSQFHRVFAFPIEDNRSVVTIAQRDAIPGNVRWEGMHVYVSQGGEKKTYELRGGLTNDFWEPISDINIDVAVDIAFSETSENPVQNQVITNGMYQRTQLQTSGQAQVHWDNITNTPTTLAGYGITDGATQTDLDDYQLLSEKGQVNGYASLDANGHVPSAQLPPLAISNTFVVASQAEMLALNALVGDVAVRTDINTSFILQSEPASTLGNWVELLTPGAPVQSVNGETGTVQLDPSFTNGQLSITGSSSVNLDSRYYTETESDGRFIRNDYNSLAIVPNTNNDADLLFTSYSYLNATAPNVPNEVNGGFILSGRISASTFQSQLYLGSNDRSLYYRSTPNGIFSNWYKIGMEGSPISMFNNDAGFVPGTRVITAGNGLTGGGDLSANRTVTMGIPSSVTLASTNSTTATSHTHNFAPGGTANQYIDGTGSLQPFPSPSAAQTLGFTDGQLSISDGNSVDLDSRYYTETEADGKFLPYDVINTTIEPNELDTEFHYISQVAVTDKPPFATTDGAVLTMIRPTVGSQIAPRQLWWGRHGEIGIRANTVVPGTKPYDYEQWYQLATHDYINAQGFLTSPSTLQEVTTAGNTTTTLIGANGGVNATFINADNVDITSADVATLLVTGAAHVPDAISVGQALTGGNAGTGLQWNATTNKLDALAQATSTLQAVTDAGNVTTNALQVTGSTGFDITQGTAILDTGFAIVDGGVSASQLVANATQAILTHGTGVNLTLQAQTPTLAGAVFNRRLGVVAAANATEALIGLNAGFGLSWNDTDNLLDFGQTDTFQTVPIHKVVIPSGEGYSFGDVNDTSSVFLFGLNIGSNLLGLGTDQLGNDNSVGMTMQSLNATTGQFALTIGSSSSSTNDYLSISANNKGFSVSDNIPGTGQISMRIGENIGGIQGIEFRDEVYQMGAFYAADYSANYTARSLVDKGYVDAGEYLKTLPNYNAGVAQTLGHDASGNLTWV